MERMMGQTTLEDGATASASSSSAEAGMIYYLKTSTPHLYDISASGPYKTINDTAPQIFHHFGAECASGRSVLQNLMPDRRLHGFEHISSPINGDPNRTRSVQLIRLHNPTVAARLPCPSWGVIALEIATDVIGRWPANARFAPVRDLEVHGTYLDEASALAAAEGVARTLAGSMTDSSIRGDARPGQSALAVRGCGADGRQVAWMIHARHDAGFVMPVQQAGV